MTALREPSALDEADYATLIAKIERERFMPCSSYKDRCVRRRIGVRIRANGLHTVGEYLRLLNASTDEWEKLMAALTINVTRFFRDATAFGALEAQAYPMLRESFKHPLHVWSAGCSHGQEAYSLAIGLAEAIGANAFTIDATDVDKESLAAATAATYAEAEMADVPPERQKRWFVPGIPARVNAKLRSAVNVARHDLLCDPMPEERYHLITCRNVIIYFGRDAQQQLFTNLYHALKPGGILLLGKVETLIGPAREMFDTIDLRERLFQRPTS